MQEPRLHLRIAPCFPLPCAMHLVRGAASSVKSPCDCAVRALFRDFESEVSQEQRGRASYRGSQAGIGGSGGIGRCPPGQLSCSPFAQASRSRKEAASAQTSRIGQRAQKNDTNASPHIFALGDPARFIDRSTGPLLIHTPLETRSVAVHLASLARVEQISTRAVSRMEEKYQSLYRG